MAREGQLRRAREVFLGSGTLDAQLGVRTVIRASWQRSMQLRVDHTSPEPTHVADHDRSSLLQIAGPVLDALSAELDNEPIAIVLTDPDGMVLDRRGGDHGLRRQLDDVSLAPGFSYTEEAMGTNGIGTALEVGGATMIDGQEHFADSLGLFSCAGAPIKHPLSGQLLGLLDLTSLARDSNPLLKVFATMAANRIQQAALELASAKQRASFDDYFATCRHAGGPVIALGPELTMINEIAQRQFSSSDQAALLSRISESMGYRREMAFVTDLPSGLRARLIYRPTLSNDQVIGGVFRIQEMSNSIGGPARTGAELKLPGAAGSSPTWQRVLQLLSASAKSRQWVELNGESGAGKTTVARAVHRHTTPGRILSVVDAGAEDPEDFVVHLEQSLDTASAVLVRHLDVLPAHWTDAVADVLQRVRDLDRPDQPWLVVTASRADNGDAPAVPANLLPFFPRAITVPPLRHHLEDLPEMIPHLLDSIGARQVTMGPDALRELMRLSWPGNVIQLRSVLATATRDHRCGPITAADLPPGCRATTRRRLSTMESLERDAIVQALAAHAGDRRAAAKDLGISRATVYRRIREYGII